MTSSVRQMLSPLLRRLGASSNEANLGRQVAARKISRSLSSLEAEEAVDALEMVTLDNEPAHSSDTRLNKMSNDTVEKLEDLKISDQDGDKTGDDKKQKRDHRDKRSTNQEHNKKLDNNKSTHKDGVDPARHRQGVGVRTPSHFHHHRQRHRQRDGSSSGGHGSSTSSRSPSATGAGFSIYRSSSTSDAYLSKDELRKRMLSWKRTTNIRKSSKRCEEASFH